MARKVGTSGSILREYRKGKKAAVLGRPDKGQFLPTWKPYTAGPYVNASKLASDVAVFLNKLSAEEAKTAKVSVDGTWAFVWVLQ